MLTRSRRELTSDPIPGQTGCRGVRVSLWVELTHLVELQDPQSRSDRPIVCKAAVISYPASRVTSLVIVLDAALSTDKVVHVALKLTEPRSHGEHSSSSRVGVPAPPKVSKERMRMAHQYAYSQFPSR